MKIFIVFLLLTAFLGVMFSVSFAQQDQTTQKSNPKIEVLKERISELESQFQTVENVEKMELAAKLADANAKLANAEFGRFERELTDTNDEWLRSWSNWFVVIFGTFVVILLGVAAVFWFWLNMKANQLIADRVERHLKGFKKAVDQVNILQDQIRILEKEHTASVLENSVHLPDTEGRLYSETVKALPDGGLLDLIVDKTRGLDFRYKAAEVLFVRKNPKLVCPVLELLNLIVGSEINWDDSDDLEWRSRELVNFLGQIHTQETYKGLTKFLNRLLVEDRKYKDLFLTWTVFSLARVSVGLNTGDLVSALRGTITDLKVLHYQDDALRVLTEYFDRFNEPEGMKEILTNGLTNRMPEVETRCLELLQKHDPDFVKEWEAQKESANTETKESA